MMNEKNGWINNRMICCHEINFKHFKNLVVIIVIKTKYINMIVELIYLENYITDKT